MTTIAPAPPTHLPEPDEVRWTAERTLKRFWHVGTIDAAEDSIDGPGTVKAVLAVSHNKERKLWVATVYQSTWHDSFTGFSVEKYEPYGPVGMLTLLTEPVARYSKKGLYEFLGKALELLDDHYAVETPEITARFTPPTEDA